MVSQIYQGNAGSTNRRFWSVMMVLLNVGLVLSLISGLAAGKNEYLLICMSIFVLIVPAAYQYLSKDRELFSPMNIIFLNLFVGVFLQTVMVCFNGDLSKSLFLDPRIHFEIITNGMLALGLATVFLVLGYSYNPASRNSNTINVSRRSESLSTAATWSRKRLLVLAVLFGVIGLASVAYFAISFNVFSDITRFSVKRHSEDGGGGGGIARFGMRFGQVACILLYAYHLACKKEGLKSGVVSVMIILFFIAAVGPFISSSRSLLLYFVLGLFVVHHFTTGGWKITNLRNAVIVVMLIIVSMGMLRYVQQRSITYSDYSEEVGVVRSISKLAVSNNFLGIKKTSILIDMVPSNTEYTFGSTYFLWMITPIPRSIWQEKPIVRIGGILGSKVFGTRDTNGIPPGFVGEAYLNFGWFGIPLMALLFGVGIRKFYTLFGTTGYVNPRSMLVYAVLFAPVAFASVSSDFTGFVSRSAQILVPLLLAMKIVGVKGRP